MHLFLFFLVFYGLCCCTNGSFLQPEALNLYEKLLGNKICNFYYRGVACSSLFECQAEIHGSIDAVVQMENSVLINREEFSQAALILLRQVYKDARSVSYWCGEDEKVHSLLDMAQQAIMLLEASQSLEGLIGNWKGSRCCSFHTTLFFLSSSSNKDFMKDLSTALVGFLENEEFRAWKLKVLRSTFSSSVDLFLSRSAYFFDATDMKQIAKDYIGFERKYKFEGEMKRMAVAAQNIFCASSVFPLDLFSLVQQAAILFYGWADSQLKLIKDTTLNQSKAMNRLMTVFLHPPLYSGNMNNALHTDLFEMMIGNEGKYFFIDIFIALNSRHQGRNLKIEFLNERIRKLSDGFSIFTPLTCEERDKEENPGLESKEIHNQESDKSNDPSNFEKNVIRTEEQSSISQNSNVLSDSSENIKNPVSSQKSKKPGKISPKKNSKRSERPKENLSDEKKPVKVANEIVKHASNTSIARISERIEENKKAKSSLVSEKRIDSSKNQVESSKKQNESVEKPYGKRTEPSKKQSEALKKQIEASKKQSESSKKQIRSLKKPNEKEIESSKKQSESSKKKIEASKKRIESSKKQNESAKNSNEKQNESSKKLTKSSAKQTESSKKQVESSKKQTESAKKPNQQSKPFSLHSALRVTWLSIPSRESLFYRFNADYMEKILAELPDNALVENFDEIHNQMQENIGYYNATFHLTASENSTLSAVIKTLYNHSAFHRNDSNFKDSSFLAQRIIVADEFESVAKSLALIARVHPEDLHYEAISMSIMRLMFLMEQLRIVLVSVTKDRLFDDAALWNEIFSPLDTFPFSTFLMYAIINARDALQFIQGNNFFSNSLFDHLKPIVEAMLLEVPEGSSVEQAKSFIRPFDAKVEPINLMKGKLSFAPFLSLKIEEGKAFLSNTFSALMSQYYSNAMPLISIENMDISHMAAQFISSLSKMKNFDGAIVYHVTEHLFKDLLESLELFEEPNFIHLIEDYTREAFLALLTTRIGFIKKINNQADLIGAAQQILKIRILGDLFILLEAYSASKTDDSQKILEAKVLLESLKDQGLFVDSDLAARNDLKITSLNVKNSKSSLVTPEASTTLFHFCHDFPALQKEDKIHIEIINGKFKEISASQLSSLCRVTAVIQGAELVFLERDLKNVLHIFHPGPFTVLPKTFYQYASFYLTGLSDPVHLTFLITQGYDRIISPFQTAQLSKLLDSFGISAASKIVFVESERSVFKRAIIEGKLSEAQRKKTSEINAMYEESFLDASLDNFCHQVTIPNQIEGHSIVSWILNQLTMLIRQVHERIQISMESKCEEKDLHEICEMLLVLRELGEAREPFIKMASFVFMSKKEILQAFTQIISLYSRRFFMTQTHDYRLNAHMGERFDCDTLDGIFKPLISVRDVIRNSWFDKHHFDVLESSMKSVFLIYFPTIQFSFRTINSLFSSALEIIKTIRFEKNARIFDVVMNEQDFKLPDVPVLMPFNFYFKPFGMKYTKDEEYKDGFIFYSLNSKSVYPCDMTSRWRSNSLSIDVWEKIAEIAAIPGKNERKVQITQLNYAIQNRIATDIFDLFDSCDNQNDMQIIYPFMTFQGSGCFKDYSSILGFEKYAKLLIDSTYHNDTDDSLSYTKWRAFVRYYIDSHLAMHFLNKCATKEKISIPSDSLVFPSLAKSSFSNESKDFKYLIDQLHKFFSPQCLNENDETRELLDDFVRYGFAHCKLINNVAIYAMISLQNPHSVQNVIALRTDYFHKSIIDPQTYLQISLWIRSSGLMKLLSPQDEK